MKACLITFHSITTLQRAAGLLKTVHIASMPQRTPRWMEQQGCGNALKVSCKDILLAVEVLQKNRIAYKKVYLYREDGSAEEMEL